MKTFAVSILCSTLALIFLPWISSAQTITINSISGTSFCSGDSVSVTFTVAGNWSQNKNNVFTIQLSDTNGSFATTFTNLTSLKDTADGTFTLSSMIGGAGTHYRIRVTGSSPYTASADNGQDITIGRLPYLDLEISDFTTPVGSLYLPVGAQVGASVHILLPTDILHPDPSQNTTNYSWDFGSGATPPTASGLGAIEESVTYSTAGDKLIRLTLTGSPGCTESSQITYHVFDCSPPAIPKYALVDTGNLNGISGKVIWVNPGVQFGVYATNDTIFCESNSSVYDRGGGNVIYLKPGASYSDLGHGSYSTIIHADGVSLDLHQPYYNEVISCPNLDFDYTNAPPNKIVTGGVREDIASVPIMLTPNPTGGMLSVQGLPPGNITISVLNILGETVLVQKNIPTPDFSIDLSQLVAGTYYVRFSSANSVVTKKIIKN